MVAYHNLLNFFMVSHKVLYLDPCSSLFIQHPSLILPVNMAYKFICMLTTRNCICLLICTTLNLKLIPANAWSYELLLPYTPKRTLRSTDKLLLTTPRTLSSYGDRAFYAAAPKLWNTLPLELRSCTSIDNFKKSLKTYLFEIAHDITNLVVLLCTCTHVQCT